MARRLPPLDHYERYPMSEICNRLVGQSVEISTTGGHRFAGLLRSVSRPRSGSGVAYLEDAPTRETLIPVAHITGISHVVGG